MARGGGDDYKFIIAAIGFIVWIIKLFVDKLRSAQQVPVPTPSLPSPRSWAPLTAPSIDTLRARLDEISARARQVADGLRHERQNRRFLTVLERWAPAEIARL